MIGNYELFGGIPNVPSELLGRLFRNFSRLKDEAPYIIRAARNFKDLTNGSETFLLPPGLQTDVGYYFVKTDASANTLTITPYGTETIEGASSYVLAAQYDSASLTFHNGVWFFLS